jgi:hypothetical protein
MAVAKYNQTNREVGWAQGRRVLKKRAKNYHVLIPNVKYTHIYIYILLSWLQILVPGLWRKQNLINILHHYLMSQIKQLNNILPGAVQWRCSNAVHKTSQCGDISHHLPCLQITSNQLSVLRSCPHNMWQCHVLFTFCIVKLCEKKNNQNWFK